MNIQEEWLERFKAVVASEIDAARGRASDGYRAVASKTGLGYDYIYQIYNGKPAHKPKRPSAEAMDSIRRAYGDASEGPATGKEEMHQHGAALPATTAFASSGTVTLAQALEVVASALLMSDDLTLDQVRPLLARLVDEPPRATEIVPRIAALLDSCAAAPGTETHNFAGKPARHEPERTV